jgi:hypothetical protein
LNGHHDGQLREPRIGAFEGRGSGGDELGRDHPFEYAFEGHGMATDVPGLEEVAVAGPVAVANSDFVIAVLAVEGDVETVDMHAMAFTSVCAGLFHLTDET